MKTLVIALLPVFTILMLSEFLWRIKVIKGEKARKFIHILAGVWMAFWPFYVPFDGIFILGCVALALLVYSRITNLFHAIYAVKRRTYGDIFYALGIIAASLMSEEPWIFTVSILLLALADGSAAVVGRYLGGSTQYHVFGSKHLKKSVVGTAAFILFVYVSVGIGWLVGADQEIRSNLVMCLVILPFATAALENTMPFGLDNIITPAFSVVLLNSIAG